MIEGAVMRARRDFVAQPQLQGELLGELGRMYLRLRAVEAAVPVLVESVTVLEEHAPPDDAALNKARAFLANAQLQTSEDREGIRALAAKARDACSNTSVDCAKARAYAANILSRLAANAGDDKLALTEIRRFAHDIERAFGATHEETALALTSLAMVARDAGHLIEASDAMRRAAALARGLQLRAENRAEIERSMAVIDLDLGRYAEARDRLLAMIPRTTGEDERSLLYRLLATVYIELGDATLALKNGEAALDLLPADDPRRQKPYAQQAEARALALAGRTRKRLRRSTPSSRASGGGSTARFLRSAARTALPRGVSGAGWPRCRRPDAASRPRDRQAMARPLRSSGDWYSMHWAKRSAKRETVKSLNLHMKQPATELLKQLPVSHPYVIKNAALRKGA
jgi:tetratricopeptide (TPR) repeat protein